MEVIHATILRAEMEHCRVAVMLMCMSSSWVAMKKDRASSMMGCDQRGVGKVRCFVQGRKVQANHF